MKFRKKPVVIEANQWTGCYQAKGVCGCREGSYIPHVHTIHANQIVKLEFGDYIIPEPDGVHFYPCKPAIFKSTYEPVDVTPDAPKNETYGEMRARAAYVAGAHVSPVDPASFDLLPSGTKAYWSRIAEAVWNTGGPLAKESCCEDVAQEDLSGVTVQPTGPRSSEEPIRAPKEETEPEFLGRLAWQTFQFRCGSFDALSDKEKEQWISTAAAIATKVRRKCEAELMVARGLADDWCEEYIKARDELKAKLAEYRNQVSEPTQSVETPISRVKRWRRDMDAILQEMRAARDFSTFHPGGTPDQFKAEDESITHLIESIMWCGMILKALGTDNPYPSSKDPSSQKVEPTADGLKL